MRAVLMALAALLLLGCAEEAGGGLPARPGRGPRGPGVIRSPRRAVPLSPERAPDFASAVERSAPVPSSDAPAPRPAGGSAAADDQREAAAARERGVQTALARAFGDPSSCISEETRDALGDRISIHVRVRVTPTGRVIDADVSGGGLSPVDRACMTRRASSIRLPGPIEGAPRSVSTTIEYTVQDTRTSETRREVPDRGLHRGTLSADRTLPAAGTAQERPAGFVAPSSTLPAQGR